MKKEIKPAALTLIIMLLGTFLFSQQPLHSVSPDWDPGDAPFTYVEKMPTAPGGKETIQKYLSNYPYPPCGLQNKLEGLVVLQFIVERNGELSSIIAMQSPDQCLSDAAIEYVKGWPLWEPGMHSGKIVRCMFTLPITYDIKAYNKRLKRE